MFLFSDSIYILNTYTFNCMAFNKLNIQLSFCVCMGERESSN